MSRPESKVKRSRALGVALTPKAARVMERRPYRPGEHGRRRRRSEVSDYQRQLLEKQRLRDQFNVSEKQMRRAFDEARRRPGRTGENLVSLLERRLDSVVLRSGLAQTIHQARQFVSHGHITVDGRKVDRPSYRVDPGQVVQVRERSRNRPPFEAAAAGVYAGEGPGAPYLDVDRRSLRTTLLREPQREEVPVIGDEQLVVEFYAR